MASDATLDELKSMDINYYGALVAFSILLYDYCLTFAAEVERCWSARRLNWGLGFFYLNRYSTLFGHVPIMLEFFWSTSNPNKDEMLVCHHLQSFHQYQAIVIQVVVGCMLIMRMYALYERSRKVLALYILVAVVILVMACWVMLGGKKEPPRDVQLHMGCGGTLSRERGIRLGAAWTANLIFDSLVFCMTLYKAIVLPRPNGVNILDILLRDGTIYFGVMVVCNLANVLTFMLGGSLTRGVATTFTNVMSSVMISRLMLNLRDPSLLLNGRHAPASTSTPELTYPVITSGGSEYPPYTSEGTSGPRLASQPGR